MRKGGSGDRKPGKTDEFGPMPRMANNPCTD